MVTGCNDGSLTLWNVNDGKALSQLPMGTSIRGMAADPKAERFAVALEDKTVRLLDSAQAREIRRFKGSRDMVAAVAFRPDGRQLAGGTNDGEAIVWDVESGSVLMRRRAGPTALSSLAWSPDGRYLLAGTLAGRGIVWAASGMQEEITLEGPQEKPASAVPVAFDPSARDAEPRLTLAGSAGVRIFELGIGRLRQRARALLTRRFTDADCVQYVRRRGCELNP